MKPSLPLSAIYMLAVGVHTAQAQTAFGLKAGVNFPSYSYAASKTLAGTATITRSYLTGYRYIRMASALYLEPEVTLQAKGRKLTESGMLGRGEVIQQMMWLDFPLIVLGRLPAGKKATGFAGG